MVRSKCRSSASARAGVGDGSNPSREQPLNGISRENCQQHGARVSDASEAALSSHAVEGVPEVLKADSPALKP